MGNFLQSPQPLFLGELENRYTDTSDIPRVPKYSCTLFMQRTPKWNLALTYRVLNQQESLYMAIMAIASKLQRMSIDMDDISEATFVIGEWDAQFGNNVITIPQKTIPFDLCNDGDTVTNIIGKMINAAVSHCMLIVATYYADNMADMKTALAANSNISIEEIKKDNEPIATYASVVVDNISETMTMENPFSIVFRYLHPEYNDKVWGSNALDTVEKYCTEFHIEVPSLMSTMTNGVIIKDYKRNVEGTEREITIAKVKQIAQFAMCLFNYRIIQQFPPSNMGPSIPWSGFQMPGNQRSF